MSTERVTIRKVAQAAGVSIATVSRVLAGSESVSATLRERVQTTARRLGYTPHAVAQSLALGRTSVIGVLVPNLANPSVCRLIKRVLHEAQESGYRLIVADSDEDTGVESTLGGDLLARTDGLILVSPRSGDDMIDALASKGKPVVVVNRPLPCAPADGTSRLIGNVTVDDYGAMRRLADHVAGLGHRRVVYLHGPQGCWEESRRFEAVSTLRERGVELIGLAGGGTLEAGHAAVPAVVESRCTAVMSFNDLMAFGVLGALHERGVDVPRDISVCGFDDVPFARSVLPMLTTARQSELGSVTWRTLERLLAGEPAESATVLAAEPVFRNSTAPPSDE